MPETSANITIAGEAAVLARRYASALYELAEEQKQLDAVAADLRVLKDIARQQDFRAVVTNPRLARTALVKAMQKVSELAKLGKLTGNFLALVAQNRRLDSLGGMIESFLGTLAERRGEFTADVRTAHALSSAQQEQLASELRTLAGGKVHLSIQKDESLLGGLTIRLGSRLIDTSVKSKLARLERQLKSA